eukprot:tig00021608_g22837.t1
MSRSCRASLRARKPRPPPRRLYTSSTGSRLLRDRFRLLAVTTSPRGAAAIAARTSSCKRRLSDSVIGKMIAAAPNGKDLVFEYGHGGFQLQISGPVLVEKAGDDRAGSTSSYCVLMSNAVTQKTLELEVLEKGEDGFDDSLYTFCNALGEALFVHIGILQRYLTTKMGGIASTEVVVLECLPGEYVHSNQYTFHNVLVASADGCTATFHPYKKSPGRSQVYQLDYQAGDKLQLVYTTFESDLKDGHVHFIPQQYTRKYVITAKDEKTQALDALYDAFRNGTATLQSGPKSCLLPEDDDEDTPKRRSGGRKATVISSDESDNASATGDDPIESASAPKKATGMKGLMALAAPRLLGTKAARLLGAGVSKGKKTKKTAAPKAAKSKDTKGGKKTKAVQ